MTEYSFNALAFLFILKFDNKKKTCRFLKRQISGNLLKTVAISVSFIDDALIRPLFVTEITVKTTNYTIFRVQQVKISKNPYIVFIFTLFFQEPVKSG